GTIMLGISLLGVKGAINDIKIINETNNSLSVEMILDNSEKVEYVTYRRVQGGLGRKNSMERIRIVEFGNVRIDNKKSNLNISIDEGVHAEYFLKNNREGGVVIEFDIPKWLDDFVKENTISQTNYNTSKFNQLGTAPKLTDISTPGISIEFPVPWIEWIEEYAINPRWRN
ncbi:MAG: WXG100 family type VII secretion target, partial [Bacilli bacterium]